MTNQFENDPFGFGDLEDDISSVPTKAPSEFAARKFTCESCNGTGTWAGGTNRHGNNKCNTCHGTGTMATSATYRRAQRAKAVTRKATAQAAAQADNVAALGGEARMDALRNAAGWSGFAGSLYEAHRTGRALSAKQVATATNMLDKLEANRKAKVAAAEAEVAMAPSVDLQPIIDMFDKATASGYKRPTYRADGLRIKPGKNGALYVMTEERMEFGPYGEQPAYEGKIEQGKFLAVRAAADDTADKLVAIAKDPLGAALRYGRRTGRCSCCGRELTKHTSIDAGIGPICAEKWGL